MGNSNDLDRKLYMLFIGLFALQVGVTIWNLKEQREWRKSMENQTKK